MTLSASGLPNSSTTLFLASRSSGFVAQPGGSEGDLCLGAPIGRYVAPGQVQVSDGAGRSRLELDLTNTPTPTGLVSALPGEMWFFQAWYRDANPQPTSNFTAARQVQFL